MTVTVAIGNTFESMLLDAPTGLVGEMGWKVIDPQIMTEVIGHRTTRITEPSPGTYFTTDTAPLTADDYLIVWDYNGVEASEALIVQVAPIIGPRYATVTDLRNYSPLVAQYSDDDLNQTLREAERWIDLEVPPAPLLDSGLKYSPMDLAPADAIQLNYATCAQAEYILHMGPGFFISGATNIAGGDYTEFNAPKVAIKAVHHLLQGGFIRRTSRVSPRRWYGGPYGYGMVPVGWEQFEKPQ